jgi:hypothetical protein
MAMNPLDSHEDHEDAAILANFGIEASQVHALLSTTEQEKKRVEREDEAEEKTSTGGMKSERRSSRSGRKSRDSGSASIDKDSTTITIGMPASASPVSTKTLSSDEEAALKNASASITIGSSSSTSSSSSSSSSSGASSIRSTVADERAREDERKRERSALERDEDEAERLQLYAKHRDELRKTRERIEADQYANYQSAKDKNLVPEETTWLLREDEAPAFGCWQGLVTGLCGRNSYPMQGINIVQKMFQPT